MKDGIIAVTEENGMVFQHFGHTRFFAIYEVKNGDAVSKKIIDAAGSGHSALGGFLRDNHVDLLICGGIGGGARNVLAAAGIELVAGAFGPVDVIVDAYLHGHLVTSDAVCDHHSHGEVQGECRGCGRGEGHTCH